MTWSIARCLCNIWAFLWKCVHFKTCENKVLGYCRGHQKSSNLPKMFCSKTKSSPWHFTRRRRQFIERHNVVANRGFCGDTTQLLVVPQHCEWRQDATSCSATRSSSQLNPSLSSVSPARKLYALDDAEFAAWLYIVRHKSTFKTRNLDIALCDQRSLRLIVQTFSNKQTNKQKNKQTSKLIAIIFIEQLVSTEKHKHKNTDRQKQSSRQ